MIYVDYREKPGKRDKTELVDLLRRIGVRAEKTDLSYGDFAFEGFGGVAIGVERKRLHDMIGCIEDSRYSAHQRLGMKKLYTESWLLIEGAWRPHDPKGLLMEGNNAGQWWECRPAGRPTMYAKLRRYLFSVERAGVPIIYTRDVWHTAYDICELYHYYQKKHHTSMREIQKPLIPTLNRKPSVTRKWAEALDGVGLVHGEEAERLFRNPIALAQSSELEWMGIPGIGPKTAKSIIEQIEGKRR